eukprot:TRINITY_DN17154_c0_g1_i1.p1 TRINITY_DN17154_c0_g1~~TRINITY_DN17154_c0_g1_i1.p1  ORF type:complete len:450 (+),score=82.59 TRINITY_DN17154_c0_g1_i1:45-1352(+)
MMDPSFEGSPDLAIAAWSDVSSTYYRRKPEFYRVYHSLRSLREKVSEHRQYVVKVTRLYVEYLEDVFAKILEKLESQKGDLNVEDLTSRVMEKTVAQPSEPTPQPKIYAAMVKGTRHKPATTHWATSLHSTSSSVGLNSSSLAVPKGPAVGGTGVHVHAYVNRESKMISITPPTATVTIQKGRDFREFNLDSVAHYSKQLEDHLNALKPYVTEAQYCCVSHISDDHEAGQDQAVHGVYKTASLMVQNGRKEVEMRAFLTDGERYKDIFASDTFAVKPGGSAMWAVLDGRFSIDSLSKVTMRDMFTVKNKVGFVKAHRGASKACVLMCVLRSSDGGTCCVFDLNTSSWKNRPNQPTPSQAIHDMLCSIRSCSEHHPLRNSRLCTILSPFFFPSESKHFLVLSLGNNSHPVTPESQALRVLFAAARVCGTQYVYRED